MRKCLYSILCVFFISLINLRSSEFELKILDALPKSLLACRDIELLDFHAFTYYSPEINFDSITTEVKEKTINGTEFKGEFWRVIPNKKIKLENNLGDIVLARKAQDDQGPLCPPCAYLLVHGDDGAAWKMRLYENGDFELVNLVRFNYKIGDIFTISNRPNVLVGNSLKLARTVPEEEYK